MYCKKAIHVSKQSVRRQENAPYTLYYTLHELRIDGAWGSLASSNCIAWHQPFGTIAGPAWHRDPGTDVAVLPQTCMSVPENLKKKLAESEFINHQCITIRALLLHICICRAISTHVSASGYASVCLLQHFAWRSRDTRLLHSHVTSWKRISSKIKPWVSHITVMSHSKQLKQSLRTC